MTTKSAFIQTVNHEDRHRAQGAISRRRCIIGITAGALMRILESLGQIRQLGTTGERGDVLEYKWPESRWTTRLVEWFEAPSMPVFLLSFRRRDSLKKEQIGNLQVSRAACMTPSQPASPASCTRDPQTGRHLNRLGLTCDSVLVSLGVAVKTLEISCRRLVEACSCPQWTLSPPKGP